MIPLPRYTTTAECRAIATSVTRWLDYFALFGSSQYSNLPKKFKIAKVGFKICQAYNKP